MITRFPANIICMGKIKSYIIIVLLVLYYSNLMCGGKKTIVEFSPLKLREMLKH